MLGAASVLVEHASSGFGWWRVSTNWTAGQREIVGLWNPWMDKHWPLWSHKPMQKNPPPKQTRIKQKTLHRHSWVPPRSKRRVYIMTSSVDIFSAVKRKRGEVDSLFPVWETDRKTPQTVRTGQERRREWWWSRGRQLYSDSCWCWGGGHYNGDINCIACGFVLWSNTIFTIFFLTKFQAFDLKSPLEDLRFSSFKTHEKTTNMQRKKRYTWHHTCRLGDDTFSWGSIQCIFFFLNIWWLWWGWSPGRVQTASGWEEVTKLSRGKNIDHKSKYRWPPTDAPNPPPHTERINRSFCTNQGCIIQCVCRK